MGRALICWLGRTLLAVAVVSCSPEKSNRASSIPFDVEGEFNITGPYSPTQTVTPQVSWEALKGAKQYKLHVDLEQECTAPFVQSYTVSKEEQSKTLDSLEPGNYFICVTAQADDQTKNAANTGYAIEVTSAPAGYNNLPQVSGLIEDYEILGPNHDIAANKLELIWRPASGAKAYQVSLSESPSCDPFIEEKKDLKAVYLVFETKLEANKNYYACLTAFDEMGNYKSPTNNGYLVRYDSEPPPTFAISGPPAVVNTPTALATWEKKEDDLFYDVIVDTESNCEPPHALKYEGLANTSKLLDSLGAGGYFFCVYARDAAGNMTAANNNGYGFTIHSDQEINLSPFLISEPGVATSNDMPLMKWEGSIGAASYDLSIGSSLNCATPLVQFLGLTTTAQQINSPLAEGTYYVCLSATDAKGAKGFATNNNLAFTIDKTVPSAFNIIGPAAAATQNPLISWQASDASHYTVTVDNENTCAAPYLQRHEGVSNTSKILTELTDGIYFVCVTAYDQAGNAADAGNNGFQLLIDRVPPGNFAVGALPAALNDDTPTFTWGLAIGASHYQVIIDNESTCLAPYVQMQNNVTVLNFSAAVLAEGDYFLCVKAFDNAGNVKDASNNPLQFSIDTTSPGSFAIIGPAASNQAEPVIQWGAASDTFTYTLIVDSESTCNSPHVQKHENLTTTAKTISDLADGNYFLCVTAIDTAGNGIIASNNGFAMSLDRVPPGSFAITSNIGVTTDATPTFTWATASGSAHYEVFIDTESSCSAPHIETNSNVAGASFTAATLGDDTYFFCVLAVDSHGNKVAASNSPLSFAVDTTGPGAFQINTADYASNTPTVSWTVAQGAQNYSLIIDDESSCAVPSLQAYSGITETAKTLSNLAVGTYHACVSAYDSLTNSTLASNTGSVFNIDKTAPDQPAPPSDEGVSSSSTQLVFSWSEPNDGGPGSVASYRLKVGTSPGMGNTFEQNVGNVLNYTVTVPGTANKTYYASVKAIDSAGNASAWSYSSDGIAVYVETLPPLSGFTAVQYSESYAVRLTLTYADPANYKRIDIRRVSGASAPADCSTGVLAYSVKEFEDSEVIDDIRSPGIYSYRACIYDGADNVIGVNTSENVAVSSVHQAFITSQTFQANLNLTYQGQTFANGIEGADFRCQYLAGQAGLGDRTWMAILSSQTAHAKDRIAITGPVFNFNSEKLANDSVDFWDGTLQSLINYAENKTLRLDHAWTNTDGNGNLFAATGTTTCNEFQTNTTSTSYSVRVGYSGNADSNWSNNIARYCNNSESLYCVNTTHATANNFPLLKNLYASATAGNGNVHLILKLKQINSLVLDRIEIRRRSGVTAPAATCNDSVNDTVVSTIDAGDFAATIKLDDATGAVGTYSYRACLYDGSDTLLGSITNQAMIYGQKVFVTSTTYSGDLGGLLGADLKCQLRAEAGGLPGNWNAILSSSTKDAKDRINVEQPVYNMNNQLVDTNSANMWANLSAAVVYDEFGVSQGTSYAWTGSDALGMIAGTNHCEDWRSMESTKLGRIGATTSASATWIAYSSPACNLAYRLYCISQNSTNGLVKDFQVYPAKAGADGQVALDIDFNSNGYLQSNGVSQVVIRRKKGNTSPAVTCDDALDSDNAIVATLAPPFDDYSENDSTGYGQFTYRICLYNSSSQLIATHTSNSAYARDSASSMIFVTSVATDPTFGGIAGGDAFCQAQAQAAGYQGTFHAILSDASHHVKNRFTASAPRPILNSLGQRVVDEISQLWSGGAIKAQILDEHRQLTFNNVFTGSNASGDAHYYGNVARNCQGWNSNIPGATYDTLYGRANYTTSQWLYSGTSACNFQYSLYCLSGDDNIEFAVASENAGEFTINVDFGDYNINTLGKAEIRRLEGAAAPACNSGILVHTLTSLSEQMNYTDSVSGMHSYTLCLYDNQNNVVFSTKRERLIEKSTALIFVTSANMSTSGSIGSLVAADSKCNMAASQGSLSLQGSWKALLSTNSIDARDRFSPGGKIYNLTGQVVAHTINDFWNSSTQNAVRYDENIVDAGSANVYTGSLANGILSGYSCQNASSVSWQTAAASELATYGRSNATGLSVINYGNTACNGALRLYCYYYSE